MVGLRVPTGESPHREHSWAGVKLALGNETETIGNSASTSQICLTIFHGFITVMAGFVPATILYHPLLSDGSQPLGAPQGSTQVLRGRSMKALSECCTSTLALRCPEEGHVQLGEKPSLLVGSPTRCNQGFPDSISTTA